MTCGSVWECPICSAHVSERRADEIRSAMVRNSGAGGSAAFATFTVSHLSNDGLEELLAGFLAAFRRLTSKPSYARLRRRYGVLGYVRVLEVTHGRNGWHLTCISSTSLRVSKIQSLWRLSRMSFTPFGSRQLRVRVCR